MDCVVSPFAYLRTKTLAFAVVIVKNNDCDYGYGGRGDGEMVREE